MDAARKVGKVRSIGVSNFSVREVKEALDTGFPLVNNQIEYNLNHQPGDILDYCLEHKMTVTAYSPLEHGSRSQEIRARKFGPKIWRRPRGSAHQLAANERHDRYSALFLLGSHQFQFSFP